MINKVPEKVHERESIPMLLCNSCTNNVGRCSDQCPVTWNQKSEKKVTAKLIVEADLCSFLLFKGCGVMMTIKVNALERLETNTLSTR